MGPSKQKRSKVKGVLFHELEHNLQCSRFKRAGGNNVATKALYVRALKYAWSYTVHLCPEMHILKCMFNFGKRHQVSS